MSQSLGLLRGGDGAGGGALVYLLRCGSSPAAQGNGVPCENRLHTQSKCAYTCRKRNMMAGAPVESVAGLVYFGPI